MGATSAGHLSVGNDLGPLVVDWPATISSHSSIPVQLPAWSLSQCGDIPSTSSLCLSWHSERQLCHHLKWLTNVYFLSFAPWGCFQVTSADVFSAFQEFKMILWAVCWHSARADARIRAHCFHWKSLNGSLDVLCIVKRIFKGFQCRKVLWNNFNTGKNDVLY